MKNLYRSAILACCLMFTSITAFSQSTTFSYTGSQQIYVVPQGCVTSVQIDAYGAQGGGNAVSPGGMGGHVQATIPALPGETLYVYVGGTGDVNGPAGYNGGGTGIGGSPNNPGSGGGGASDVRKGGTALTDRYVVAGAGGGGMENGGAATGGAGGGLIGGDGYSGGNPWGCSPLVLPTGGTQSTGGLGGTSTSCAWNGFNGTFGQGGNSYNNYRSAGGGGGWYGGGGAHNGTSGAGGSSYTHPSATNVVHNQGVWTGDGQVVITVNSAVYVNLGPDTTIGGALVLNAGNPGYTYIWNTSATTQSITVTTTGSYAVVVSDTGGCIGSDSISVTIGTPPTVTLGADTTICATLLLDAGNPGNSYQWSTGDTTETITANAGTYAVTVTDGAGCSAADSILLTMAAAPNVNLGGATAACDMLMLDAGNPGESYLWSTGDTSQVIMVSSSGTYAVTVTEDSGCLLSGSDTVQVTIHPSPTVSFAGLGNGYCTTDPIVTMTGTPPGGTFSGPGVNGNTFNPAVAGAGQQTVTYTLVDSNGCSGTASITTLVTICVAIANPIPADIQIHPNPSNGIFTIEGMADATEIDIYDPQGKHVLATTQQGASATIDLSQQTKGIYFLRLRMNGKTISARVIVQ